MVRDMHKTVAIGIQDFEELRNGNYYYIDKTDFIREWWESGDSVTLIARPRRFGNSSKSCIPIATVFCISLTMPFHYSEALCHNSYTTAYSIRKFYKNSKSSLSFVLFLYIMNPNAISSNSLLHFYTYAYMIKNVIYN